jgi:AraC-like DNA-binding protein
MMSVSEKKLNKATNQVLGKSPKEIIDERVVLEAKRLLVHTSKSIKEVGFELGFDEPTNFIKYFKKHVGRTPIEFKGSFYI